MSLPDADRVRRWMSALTLAVGFGFVLVYLVVALARIGYPYELEWMEGGMVAHVRRVLAGQPIYAKPSLEFVSFLYPPLYYEAASAFARVLGPGFLPLRLLSFVSSLGVFALLYSIVRKESGSAVAGGLAAGIFAATYDRLGGWFDLARLDSFYLLLVLAAIHVLRFSGSAFGASVAGLLIGAAFLTKQSALVVALALLAWIAFTDLARAPWFAAFAGLVIGGGTLLLDRATGGWFHYYCFFLPSRHPRIEGGALSFWTTDLLPALPLASVLALVALTLIPRERAGRERLFLPALAVGMIGTSWSVRNMFGAEVNNLFPAFAAIAMLAPLGAHALAGRTNDGGTAMRRRLAVAGQALLLLQLLLLVYDPRKHLPGAEDRAAGDGLVTAIASIPGEVFVPHHGYLAERAGKRAQAHTLAMDNVFLDDDGPARRDLENEVMGALREKRFAAALLESDGRYGPAILESYEVRARLFEREDVFWPVTGGRLRPETLCLPK